MLRPTARPRSVIALAAALLLLAMASASALSASALSAEIRLRTQCQTQGTVVTLGDVAQVFAADRHEADRLAAIELFPSPAVSRKRFVGIRELQELLATRGVDRFDHRFSGAAQVAIVGSRPMTQYEQKSLPASFLRRSERRACELVKQFLLTQVSAESDWIVEVALQDDQAQLLLDPRTELSILPQSSAATSAGGASLGGPASWIGTRSFEVAMETAEGTVRFPLQAGISLPPAVVVASRLLARGTLIRPGDVELQHEAIRANLVGQFTSIEEVIGMETTQPISEGTLLLRGRSVRAPILVKRGDVVTVIARTAGIRVQTTGRAREEGSLGQAIKIESLGNRETFFARVSKWREVEIYVQPTIVEPIRRAVGAAEQSRSQYQTPRSQFQTPRGQLQTQGADRDSFIR